MIETRKLARAQLGAGARSLLTLDSQKVVLVGIIAGIGAGVWFLGALIAPIIASVVIAYILDGITLDLRRKGLPRTLVAALMTAGFVALVAAGLFMAGPLLVSQTAAFAQSLPRLAAELQSGIVGFVRENETFVSEEDLRSLTRDINQKVVALGQGMVVSSVGLLPTLATVVMYMMIVPLMLFFLIRDRDEILAWAVSFLPQERRLADKVWSDLSVRFGGYLRGVSYEILIVGGACYVSFLFLGLDYPVLLASIAGLSVLIPYFGATVAGGLVLLVAYSQWGLMSNEFLWTALTYVTIQFIDGALLATVLLASTVKLHPVAVMSAVLVAGQLLGFWGLIFAIPLASAAEVVIDTWRKRRLENMGSTADEPTDAAEANQEKGEAKAA